MTRSHAVTKLTADLLAQLETVIAARAVELQAELTARALGRLPKRRGRPPGKAVRRG